MKNGHQAMVMAFAKWSLWVKIRNGKKTCNKRFYKTLQFYAKDSSKKQLIFEKWDHSDNWQEKRPPSKGYSICKIVTLGQKWKMQENMLKTFLQEIPVFLCKKQLGKRVNIRKMRPFWRLGKTPTKAIVFANWSL